MHLSSAKWPMLCCFMHHKYTEQVQATGLKCNKRRNKCEQGADNFIMGDLCEKNEFVMWQYLVCVKYIWTFTSSLSVAF